jgi:hypothetical protein
MAPASAISKSEVSLIRSMLRLHPKLSNQAILSYFTKPGRDINHRVIAEIAGGWLHSTEPPASTTEALAYMAAMSAVARPEAADFLTRSAVHSRESRTTGSLVLDWWPVGQGIFSSGAILRNRNSPLTWVYDCGTTSSDTILQKSIDKFEIRQRRIGADVIHLAVLSHFDKDHISGFIRLIRRFPIRILLLPYVPQWQRLVIAIEQGVLADDENFAFFLDPVSFLRDIDGGEIGEIVFVPSPGPEFPAPDPAPEAGRGPIDLDGDKLHFDEEEPTADALLEPSITASAGTPVRFLRKGGRIVSSRFWEFVPYNDVELSHKATPAFRSAVAPLINDLLASPARRTNALASLKALYRQHFGRSSTARNRISLFLYSGPLSRQRLRLFNASHLLPSQLGARFSQMHTGDGALDTIRRYDAFKHFFAFDSRLQRAGILQVMHHGSKGSWHEGIADKLNPAISVFSSDPTDGKYGHPHAEVLRDFWTRCAIQVDRRQGFHYCGLLER